MNTVALSQALTAPDLKNPTKGSMKLSSAPLHFSMKMGVFIFTIFSPCPAHHKLLFISSL